MPTNTTMCLPKIKDPKEFENICCDIMKKKFAESDFGIFGRNGQKQWGIDIFSKQKIGEGHIVVQCKNYLSYNSQKKNSFKNVLLKDINATKELDFPVVKMIIMTAIDNDSNLRKEIIAETDREPFEVDIIFWDEIQTIILSDSTLLAKYYPSYYPINMKEAEKAIKRKDNLYLPLLKELQDSIITKSIEGDNLSIIFAEEVVSNNYQYGLPEDMLALYKDLIRLIRKYNTIDLITAVRNTFVDIFNKAYEELYGDTSDRYEYDELYCQEEDKVIKIPKPALPIRIIDSCSYDKELMRTILQNPEEKDIIYLDNGAELVVNHEVYQSYKGALHCWIEKNKRYSLPEQLTWKEWNPEDYIAYNYTFSTEYKKQEAYKQKTSLRISIRKKTDDLEKLLKKRINEIVKKYELEIL